jgi:hypothetical protein
MIYNESTQSYSHKFTRPGDHVNLATEKLLNPGSKSLCLRMKFEVVKRQLLSKNGVLFDGL